MVFFVFMQYSLSSSPVLLVFFVGLACLLRRSCLSSSLAFFVFFACFLCPLRRSCLSSSSVLLAFFACFLCLLRLLSLSSSSVLLVFFACFLCLLRRSCLSFLPALDVLGHKSTKYILYMQIFLKKNKKILYPPLSKASSILPDIIRPSSSPTRGGRVGPYPFSRVLPPLTIGYP